MYFFKKQCKKDCLMTVFFAIVCFMKMNASKMNQFILLTAIKGEFCNLPQKGYRVFLIYFIIIIQFFAAVFKE